MDLTNRFHKKFLNENENYNPAENIWNKIENSGKIGQDKFDIYFCILFNSYCESLVSVGERDGGRISPP